MRETQPPPLCHSVILHINITDIVLERFSMLLAHPESHIQTGHV